jgi:hypothetical protein
LPWVIYYFFKKRQKAEMAFPGRFLFGEPLKDKGNGCRQERQH